MSDEPLNLPQEDNDSESAETDAFSDYVNDHLDLSDLGDAETFADERRADLLSGGDRGTVPRSDDYDPWEVGGDTPDDDGENSEPRRAGGVFGMFRPNLSPIDHDDDDDEDAGAAGLGGAKPGLGSFVPPDASTPSINRPPTRRPSGQFSYDPPLRTGGGPTSGPFGSPFSRLPGNLNTPPRVPIPSAGDSRWILYAFRARPHLEIHHPASLTSPARVTVIPNAATTLDGRLYAISSLVPGWIAVKVTLTMRQPIIGFVRADHLHLGAPSPVQDWTTSLYKYAISEHGSRFLQATLLVVLVMLMLMLVVRTGQPLAPMPDLTAIEIQLSEQDARIDALEARLQALGAR